MSKLADLAYDIEQMYIEGYRPHTIAAMLECDPELVYNWLEQNGLMAEQEEPIEYYGA